LKAGGAYVPIDPGYPQERIDFILEDTGALLVLTQEAVAEDQLSHLPKKRLLSIDLERSFYNDNEVDGLTVPISPTDLCYVIYTSGTTGKPKGVMIEHRNLNHIIHIQSSSLSISAGQRVLQYASLVFDASVWEIFRALSVGAELHIINDSARQDGDEFFFYIKDFNIQLAILPPAFLKSLSAERFDLLLPTLCIAGDSCSLGVMERWSRNRKFINAYGPTEGTVCSTMHDFQKGDIATNVGGPNSNTQVYVLDNLGNPVPVGVVGELYVGGAGIARGYLNSKELTAERFVTNPFATKEDKEKGYTRLYRTGDLVRWSSDGNLEYIGRNDDQVKMRGYRIELSEIEAVLSNIEGIARSCVLVKERSTDNGTSKYLVGYYVATGANKEISSEGLIEALSRQLPDYMVPTAFISMEEFPMTTNGKLDKHALPDPAFSASENYVAPETELETALCGIWASVLGLEQVGTTDHFFRIGGDSILSIQVSGRIRDLGYSCQVKDLFNYPTIGRLSIHLETATSLIAIEREEGVLTGSFSYLPIQQWFFDQIDQGVLKEPSHWNQSFMIRVPALDKRQLLTALTALVEHHDMFRVVFENGVQRYRSEVVLGALKELDVQEYDEAGLSEVLTDWQAGFSMTEGPLFQFGYLYGYEDGSARVYMALHHLIVDAVSWRILTKDLERLYSGGVLPPKGSSYRQWVSKINGYSGLYPKEANYWESQVSDLPNYDGLRVSKEKTKTLKLTKAQTVSLLQDAPKAYHTGINDLLLTALGTALSKLTDSDVAGLTLEGHGRELLFDDIDHSNTLGWYTSMFPVRLFLSGDLSQDIRSVKEELRKIPNNGMGFGSFAVSDTTDYGFSDLPNVSFNYLGQFDGDGSVTDWQLVAESSGASVSSKNINHNIININGGVLEGRLQFSVDTYLSLKDTKALAAVFKDTLISIISHCQERLSNIGSWYTPSDFSYAAIGMPLLDRLQRDALAKDNGIAAIYPVNSLQQGFIYHTIEQPEDDAYRLQLSLDYDTNLNISNYLKAWEYCIAKYPILRTAFNWEEELIQIIYTKGVLSHTYHDLSDLASQDAIDNRIASIQEADRKVGYDMMGPTLLRLHIIKQREDKYTILKSEHHSISDGWSTPIVIGQVHEYYERLVQGGSIEVEEDTVYGQVQEYIQEHRSSVALYWKEALSSLDSLMDIDPLLDRPLDFGTYREIVSPKENSLEITSERYTAIKATLQKEGLPLNILVQFLWHKLLSVYGGSPRTIVGTNVSGRNLPIRGIEESVGLYINTLPLIIDWEKDRSVLEQLHHIQDRLRSLNENSIVNLSSLHLEGQRLFQSLLVFQNYPISEEVKKGNGLPVSVRGSEEKINYPLRITAEEDANGLSIKLGYDEYYLSEQKAALHMEAMSSLLDQLLEDIDRPQSGLRIVSAEDYRTMVHDWNATDVEYPEEETIVSLFESQVAKVPNQVAVVFEGEELTYQDLNERANRLAHHLRDAYSLESDDLVGIMLDRSLWSIISMLGILKAGGAYVAINPEYPKDRKSFIIHDTDLKILIIESQSLFDIMDYDVSIFSIDIEFDELPKDEVYTNNPSFSISPKDLCYVIYTSGTTGRPKGVMIEHRNLNHLIHVQSSYLFIVTGQRVLQYASLVFDASVWEIFSTLCVGAELHIINTVTRQDRKLLPEYIKDFAIDLVILPPVILETLSVADMEGALPTLVIGGDSCALDVMEGWSLNRRFINAYGPTEGTICTTMHNFYKGDIANTIGNSLPHLRAYVLDSFQKPVPIGVIGELYIGGAGVARGYLNRKELTQERFVENPFATEVDKVKGYIRMYRTGDLVRYLSNGNLEYMGRNDDQVKIRGHRIELGEIETVVSGIEGIAQSCVLAKERSTDSGTNKYLVGYYVVSDPDTTISSEDLIEALSEQLPDYMVPSAFVNMEAFPTTFNGKLDKRALPNPEFSVAENYIAPETKLEKALCAIWESVLSLEQVGVTDHFFRIGGNSILAMQLAHQMNQAFDKDIKVQIIFQYSTIREIVELLEKGNQIQISSGLVKISSNRSTTTKKKIFCAPGAGGNIVSFYELGRLLEESHIVYGFQAYGLDANSKVLETIPLIASQNILDMQAEDPTGPYHLAGYSFGTRVVYEMAIQLQERGFEVASLYIFDGIPFDAPDEILEENKISFTEHLLEIIDLIFQYSGKSNTSTLTFEHLKDLSESQQLRHAYEIFLERDMAFMSESDFQRFVSVHIHQTNLPNYYTPNYQDVLDCAIHLFSIKDPDNEMDVPEDYGWQSVCNKEVIIHPAGGIHMTMLDQPHVTDIAELIVKHSDTELSVSLP
uniref:amino acid adenylation domain-containing protein n=1 Tax=Maribacter sp. 2-571 TaxID=3417569 RepID=UPI003D34B9CE